MNVQHGDERLPIRFWDKVVPEPMSGCWLWIASANNMGYGKLAVGGRFVYAHRHAYETLVGPIAPGLDLDHLCRNTMCCNPAHLEPVSHTENVRRGDAARSQGKTHCPKGHAYEGANVRIVRGKYKVCVTCQRAAQACYDKRTRGTAS